jgi:ectoine hydroxylase-related dioxygenase (phytanoyl-CoA dioxygenase family)
MTALATGIVSRDEQDGYCVVANLLAAADVAAIRDRINEIAAGEGAAFPRVNIELEPRPDACGRPVPRKINHCAEHDAIFMRLAQNPRILDVVEALIGLDLKLFGSQCFMKPAGGVEKPYHQDSAYFPRAAGAGDLLDRLG